MSSGYYKKKKHKRPTYLTYKKQLAKEYISRYPHWNLISNTLGAFFLISIGLLIWEIYIFRDTFIDLYTPLTIWVFSGFIITPFFKRIINLYILNPYSPGSIPIIWHFIYNIVSWGGLIVFLFMWSNYHFSDKQPKDVSLPINSYGHLAKGRHGCGNPYVTIVYKEQIKELVFPCDTPIENYKTVHLIIEKGLLGFEVIKDQKL